MKLFTCDHCGNTLHFENVACTSCGHQVGYLPHANMMVALAFEDGTYRSVRQPEYSYVFCDNARHGACNWLVEARDGGELFCLACRHNETVPDLNEPANVSRFATIERAKKRLFYSLLRLGLPVSTRNQDPRHGLVFRFLADMPATGQHIMTGHENGLITLSLAEADDAEREKRRTGMGEPYRTLLGHFRHEVGHHYWDLLIDHGPQSPRFRELFGDESKDYGLALQNHYAGGPPPSWPESFISGYAAAHPWEDFAETWAHYLHITDTLETAAAFGLRTRPQTGSDLAASVNFDPYKADRIEPIIEEWVPVSALTNSLNRSMGTGDAYPFVLSHKVVAKLGFIHQLVHQHHVEPVPA